MYSIDKHSQIIRESDGATIPADHGNCDFAEYLRWIEGGNRADIEDETPLSHPRYYGNDKLDKQFTRAEQEAVVTASMTDPVVKLMYDRLLGAAYLSYEDPETEEGLELLVRKGLLKPERKAEIVAAMQPA